MRYFARLVPLLAATMTVGLGAASTPAACGPYRITREVWLRVEARSMLLRGETSIDLGVVRVDIPPGEQVRQELSFGDDRPDDAPSRIVVEFSGTPGEGERPHGVALRSRFVRADGATVRAERDLQIREGATAFFEAGHGPGWRLTLAIRAERQERPVVRAPSAIGRAVLFRVDVGRVVNGEFFAVESNDLSTFEGETVEYMFRLGHDETLEHIRLALTPARLEDALVEILVDLSGTLHAGLETPLLLSRHDTLFTDRGTTSEITATVGDPPDGFAFRITPIW